MRKKKLYWICQLFGWALFIVLQIVFFRLFDNTITPSALIYFILGFFLGILLTHGFRWLIIRWKWLARPLLFQIPAVILGSFFMSVIFEFVQVGSVSLFYSLALSVNFTELVQSLVNISFVFILWNLIYFSFYYFENYRKSEITNLKFQFSMNEIELNKLKSQLNPHFMFNAMNSIRALIDEDPIRAKEAVTMLSNILRNTLQMEKNKLICFDDELKIVKDYLELEHIRFEKRLSYSLEFNQEAKSFLVPTMMIQTLVENGIKHGISKLVDGGTISVVAKADQNILKIRISNPGQLNLLTDKESGYGIKNTKQRLDLLYGNEGKFQIYQSENIVVTEISLPKSK